AEEVVDVTSKMSSRLAISAGLKLRSFGTLSLISFCDSSLRRVAADGPMPAQHNVHIEFPCDGHAALAVDVQHLHRASVGAGPVRRLPDQSLAFRRVNQQGHLAAVQTLHTAQRGADHGVVQVLNRLARGEAALYSAANLAVDPPFIGLADVLQIGDECQSPTQGAGPAAAGRQLAGHKSGQHNPVDGLLFGDAERQSRGSSGAYWRATQLKMHLMTVPQEQDCKEFSDLADWVLEMEQQRSPALQHPSHPWINPDPATVVQETSDTKSDIEQMQPQTVLQLQELQEFQSVYSTTEAFDGGRAGFYYDAECPSIAGVPQSQSSYEDRFYNYHGQSDGMTGCGCNNTNCCFYRSSNSTDNESNLQQDCCATLTTNDSSHYNSWISELQPQPQLPHLYLTEFGPSSSSSHCSSVESMAVS
uniref:ETS domain-containing protein n=1 Tax=Macrostomum lignano TaxID=282301 RepID=A0A1I8IXM4_9PLAT